MKEGFVLIGPPKSFTQEFDRVCCKSFVTEIHTYPLSAMDAA